LLLVVALSVSTTVSLLARFKVGVPGNAFEQVVTFANGHLTGVLTIFVALMWLYRVIPYRSLAWRDTLIGAAIAAVFVELAKTVFVVYTSGIADFETVYGSLSSVIVLMLWLYVAAHIILLGSEVMAVSRDERA
jgi:YihY family inner membrane protein